MYFDFIKDARLPGGGSREFIAAGELYSYCSDAEKYCRTNPDNAIIAIRQALEVLVSALLCENGKSSFTRSDSLFNMINELRRSGGNFITRQTIAVLHELRSKANDYVHVEKRVNNSSEYVVRGRHATVADASEATVKLYRCLSIIFGRQPRNISIDELPIGEYAIIARYPKYDYEAVTGDYKFLTEKKGSLVSSYAYVRPFSNVSGGQNSVYNERDIAIQDVFKSIPHSDYVVSGEEIPVSGYTDVRYIKYNVMKNTETLDRISGSLSLPDALKIIRDVSQGLIEIMSGSVRIHHRSIRPTCIFVNREGDEIKGRIGCFETAKVEIESQSVETVHINMMRANQGNVFTHPMLRNMQSKDDENWERGDVFSLAVLLMYCINPSSVNDGAMDYAEITEVFTEEFAEMMINILMSGSLMTVPGMKEFHSMICLEIEYVGA